MNQYSLTPEILSAIANIERIYGQLEALRLPGELRLNLERDNLVQSSYISNSIEGNPLSYPEVSNLILGGRVPANRGEKEIRNYFDILKNLESRVSSPFSVAQILKIHKDLMTGIEDEIAGIIRDTRVIIGSRRTAGNKVTITVKHEPPFHDAASIMRALENLVDWYNAADDVIPVVKIALFHHRYVYIHPFADGNGRTVRLLTSLLFIRAGYKVNEYFVLDDYYDIDRLAYSDALHSADSGDSTKWVEYFTAGIKYSLASALAKAKNALSTLGVMDRPTGRERQALELFAEREEITSAEAAEMLGVSRQQAQNLLAGLVKKGLVKKFGRTKKSYYRIAR
jgi:Fic family protein